MDIQDMMKRHLIDGIIVFGKNFSFDFEFHHFQPASMISFLCDKNFRFNRRLLRISRTARHMIAECFSNMRDVIRFKMFFAQNKLLKSAFRLNIPAKDHFLHDISVSGKLLSEAALSKNPFLRERMKYNTSDNTHKTTREF